MRLTILTSRLPGGAIFGNAGLASLSTRRQHRRMDRSHSGRAFVRTHPRRLRNTRRAPMTVIALPPPVPFHLLGN